MPNCSVYVTFSNLNTSAKIMFKQQAKRHNRKKNKFYYVLVNRIYNFLMSTLIQKVPAKMFKSAAYEMRYCKNLLCCRRYLFQRVDSK